MSEVQFKPGDRVTGTAHNGQALVGWVSANRELAIDDETLLLYCEDGSTGGSFAVTATIRPAPIPSQTEEPKVGETWETSTTSLPRQMTIGRIERDADYPYVYEQDYGLTASYSRRQLVRRLDAPPSVPEPAPPPERKYVITARTDPYALHRFTNDDATVAAKMIQRDARLAKRARFTADTLADLDRPMLKLGGRFGRSVPVTHPVSWPSVGDDEP
jgi:hypothetical protein